jgi:hypothetical protein
MVGLTDTAGNLITMGVAYKMTSDIMGKATRTRRKTRKCKKTRKRR